MENLTPWMTWMLQHVGEHEVFGSKDNPFIMDLYQFGHYPKQHDEVPWCACCANAALIKNGFKGSGRADAVSFCLVGTPCAPQYGSIIVIKHPNGHYHVTFFVRWVDEKNRLAECLGGNQSDALKVSTFNLSGNVHGHDEIVASRWPEASK